MNALRIVPFALASVFSLGFVVHAEEAKVDPAGFVGKPLPGIVLGKGSWARDRRPPPVGQWSGKVVLVASNSFG